MLQFYILYAFSLLNIAKNVQCTGYDCVQIFSVCTILLNFQKHCVQYEQNVHSSHPEYHITHQNSKKFDIIKS